MKVLFLFVATLSALPALAGGIGEEFRVKRKPVFEFRATPNVSRNGDEVTIRFTAKAFCDATVAIEDAEGRILRHLACGVLGPNAPNPFRKDSLEQKLAWDGKDDQGDYVDDLSRVAVRVSLGLQARFERHFMWAPHRRITAGVWWEPNLPAPFAAGPNGVYVCDGNLFDHVRLFDHEGRYKRTVYPFPSDKLGRLKGVPTKTFPQSGKTLPVKGGGYESTMLTSGTTAHGGYLTQLKGRGATAMAVGSGRIALAMLYMNRLGTDGSTGGLPITGPATTVFYKGPWFKRDTVPRSSALSPDGKTVYLAGFFGSAGVGANHRVRWIQGVGRIGFEDGEKLEVFAGTFAKGEIKGGTKPGEFRVPSSVAVDRKGRVYVADHFNNRVQVFDPSGKHLKSLPVAHPVDLSIDPRTGELYVFSWHLNSMEHGTSRVKPQLAHLGPFEKPDVLAKYSLPLDRLHGRSGSALGLTWRALVDPWAPAGPTVWLFDTPGSPPSVFRVDKKGRKLVKIADFDAMTTAAMPAEKHERLSGIGRLTRDWNWRMAVNPVTGDVFVLRKGPDMWDRPFVIRPDTGRIRSVSLPFEVDDMAFDIDGHAYLRRLGGGGGTDIVRYDVSHLGQWREIPFDYGESRRLKRGEKILSALPVPGGSLHHQGGIWVSAKGHIAVAYTDAKWRPKIFRGRGGNTMVSIWDRHGKPVHRDAVRGIGYVDGLFIDKDDNVYLASDGRRTGYFSGKTGTLAKLRPAGRILSRRGAIVPLKDLPDRPQETDAGWWQGAEWFYGGLGFTGKPSPGCHCPHYRPTHDYFARTFAPETQHYTVAVLDSAGNLILRIGRYGNVDEGVPLIDDGTVKGWKPRSIGGDEVGLFYPAYLATHSDRRLYIADPGNMRIVCVKLGYHTSHSVRLVERD
jgi:hypothetical protein